MLSEKPGHVEPFCWIGADAFADNMKVGYLIRVADRWHWHMLLPMPRRRSGWRSTERQARRMIEAAYTDFLEKEVAGPRPSIPSAQLRLFLRPGDDLGRLIASDAIIFELGKSFGLSVRRIPSLKVWRYKSSDGEMFDLRWHAACDLTLQAIVEVAAEMARKLHVSIEEDFST